MNEENRNRLVQGVTGLWLKAKHNKDGEGDIALNLDECKLGWVLDGTIYKITFNDKSISKHCPYRVQYKCLSCEKEHICCLSNLSRKMNQNTITCEYCKDMCEKKYSGSQLVQESKEAFEKESDKFKAEYARKHMTCKQFETIKSQIISIQNGKFTQEHLGTFEFIHALKIPNQSKYNHYLWDKTRDVFEKIEYIKWKCLVCSEIFVNRDLKIQKDKAQIECKACRFANRTFKIQKTKNYLKEHVTYQSQYELKFVRFCNDHQIRVLSGPHVPYQFEEKEHIYQVDYILPDLGILVELKDNHQWHRENLASGKWTAKENAVRELVTKGEYKAFHLVYPKNYVEATRNFDRLNKLRLEVKIVT